MIRTFLVAVELGEAAADLTILSEDIKESLESDGFDVSSVKPWDSPTPAVTNAFSLSLDQQPQTGYGQ